MAVCSDVKSRGGNCLGTGLSGVATTPVAPAATLRRMFREEASHK